MTSPQTQTHYRTCNLCEAMCGVAIEYEDTQILSIKGDASDPFSKGHICPKALALKDYHEDPDRLTKPQLKTDDGWKEISWGRAFDIVGTRIRAIQKKHGRNAVGLYLGNPNVHHFGNLIFMHPLFEALQTKNRFSATSNDQLPHMRANYEMFGHQLLFPVPDIDHTDLFILIGSNPAASNGSLMSAPDYIKRLKHISKRGGEVILIDPRKTETARSVNKHLFIKPGTDALMLLGILNTLFDEGLVDPGRLKSYIDDLAQIQLICSDYRAEEVAPLTGVAAEEIRSIARKLAATPRACMFGRMGTSVQEFGTLSTWLIYVINILTNHMDERGGLMFTKPAADMVTLAPYLKLQGSIDTYRSKSGLPEFAGELPSSTMADQILQPGNDQIRAMIVVAGNPVISSPNGKRLDKAMDSLEFMVSVDSYINETSRHADIILPATSQLERPHYDLALNLLTVRNTAKYSPALFPKPKGTKHDWEILLELTRRLGDRDALSRAKMESLYQILKRLGPEGILDIILRTGPYGTQIPGTTQIATLLIDVVQDLFGAEHPVRKLLDAGPYGSPNRTLSKGLCISSLLNYPHGIDLGSLQSSLPERLFTHNKHIKLAPASFLQDLPRLRKRGIELARNTEQDLLLIGRRHVRSNNSWLHNSHRLVKGKDRCTLMIHPNDAERLKLKDGDLAEVASSIGSLQIITEVTKDIMPGVVSIPHGWGHDRKGVQLGIAQSRPGVSANDITDDHLVDRLSGTSVLNGIAVTVCKAGAQKLSTKHSPAKQKAPSTRKSRIRVSAKLS